jgi:hypothetical protein
MNLSFKFKSVFKVLKRFKTNQIYHMEIDKHLLFIRYERDKNSLEMLFTYSVSALASGKEREFRLNRRLDESIGKTFEKLVFSVEKHTSTKKKRKNDGNQVVNESASSLVATLSDHNGQLISAQTLNNDAWKENYKFFLNDREYRVAVDLPHVKKIAFSKVILAAMPTMVSVDLPQDCQNKCFFSWYHSDTDIIPENWYLIDEGVNKRFCLLNGNVEKKLLRLRCTPNDGVRDGIPIEITSQSAVKKLFEVDELPMTKRHALTKSKLSGDE